MRGALFILRGAQVCPSLLAGTWRLFLRLEVSKLGDLLPGSRSERGLPLPRGALRGQLALRVLRARDRRLLAYLTSGVLFRV